MHVFHYSHQSILLGVGGRGQRECNDPEWMQPDSCEQRCVDNDYLRELRDRKWDCKLLSFSQHRDKLKNGNDDNSRADIYRYPGCWWRCLHRNTDHNRADGEWGTEHY